MNIRVDDPDAPITEEWLASQEFDAAFSDEDMYAIGQRQQDDELARGQNFRAALGIMSRSSAYLMERSRDDPGPALEAFTEIIGTIQNSIDVAKNDVDLMERALIRLHIIGAKLAAMVPDEDEGAPA